MKSLAATDKFAEILDWSLYQFNGSLIDWNTESEPQIGSGPGSLSALN